MKQTQLCHISSKSLLLCALLLTGCAVTPETLTLQEMDSQRHTDLARMFQGVDKVEHPITLSEVVARALRYNLDHQVKIVEELQSLDLSSMDKFELLPKLAANAAYTGRSNVSASNSFSVSNGTQSLESSTSQDRFHTTTDLGLTWNILDFGVSYFNARQNADRTLIAHERERKVIQNLVQEARSAFWRAAAAQQLEPRVQATVKLAESALLDAKKVEESQLRSPLDSLRYRKTLLESLRQLESIQQELGTAQVELATMMTLPPGTKFVLALPEGALQLPVWNTPLEKMEESALLNQPDMREMAYQGRIVVDESRKSFLKLFPGISLSASRQTDNNSFTYNKNWFDAGLRVTWNLLGLLSAPELMALNKTNEDVQEMKRLAMRMALLSQVHVSYHQFGQARVHLKRADELFQVETEISRQVGNRVANDAQSILDQISSDTSAILAELRRYQALAQAHSALGKMMATTGQDPDVAPVQAGTLAELTMRVDKWMTSQLAPLPALVKPAVKTPEAKAPEAKAAKKEVPTTQDSPVVAQNGALTVGQTGTVSTNVQVRSGHGTEYRKIRLLHPGDTFVVEEITPDGKWVRIGKKEWITTSLIVLATDRSKVAESEPTVDAAKVAATTLAKEPKATDTSKEDTRIVRSAVHVRSGHGQEYRKIRMLNPGHIITVYETTPDGQWLRIGKKEWVATSFTSQSK